MEKKKETLNPTNRAQGCVRLCQFREQSKSLLPSDQNVSYTCKNKTQQLAVLEQLFASSMGLRYSWILLPILTVSFATKMAEVVLKSGNGIQGREEDEKVFFLGQNCVLNRQGDKQQEPFV